MRAKAQLESMPTIDVLFHRVAIDMVGALPKSKQGNRYVRVSVDYATRYPEAVLKVQVIRGHH